MPEETPAKAMKRRGILAAAGAAVAGIVTKQASVPVSAAPGITVDYVEANGTRTVGINTFNGTYTTGIQGIGSDTGLSGQATTASLNAKGVIGDGGVYGFGVYGVDVYGTGVYGTTTHGNGVTGIGGVIGVSGQIPSTSGAANTMAVQGLNQSTGAGGVGVAGSSATGSGVVGGTASATPGTAGGYFYTTANSGSGVVGQCFNPGGGAAAFVGAAAAPNYAAYFTGNVVVSGRLVVSDPSYKSGALRHPDGSTRLVYCVESPESWIEDVGTGTLAGGKARVQFDADFAAVTHTDDYHVFLTSYDPASKGLAVATRTTTGFAVQEHAGGTSSGAFSWKVMVKAKSEVKAERLGKFTMPTITVADKPPAFPAPVASVDGPLPAPGPVSAPAPPSRPAAATVPVAPAAPAAPVAPTGQGGQGAPTMSVPAPLPPSR